MFDVVPEGLKLNYTATLSYGEGLPFLSDGIQNERARMADELMVPVIVEPQLTPTKSVELGVIFDTFVSSDRPFCAHLDAIADLGPRLSQDDGINRAAFNNIVRLLTCPRMYLTDL